jgi:hypothetical protein
MKSAGRIFLTLFFLFFLTSFGRAEAGTEWVKLVTDGAAGYVVSAYDCNAYMIDVGISMGARRGGLYLAYAEGPEAYGAYGEPVGRQMIPLALLKVREPSTTHSFCTIVAPIGGLVLPPGARVVPISAKRAKSVRFAGFAEYAEYDEGYFIPSVPVVAPAPMPAQAAPLAPLQSLPPSPPAQEPPYPPYPNYPAAGQTMLDFDANNIADARLIRTFPLSQEQMNALEIEHRGAWNLYSSGRFMEAFDSFSRQSASYAGNYLSPYWAGMSALRMGNLDIAGSWFDTALMINPYFAPARNAKINGPRYLLQQQQQNQKKQPVRKAFRTKTAPSRR